MSAHEDFEAIRRYIRNICVHDQPRWESTWTAILANNKTARRGLVFPDVFVRTLEENNVFFHRKTARALVEQFQASNGGVQATKFLKWVELSRPADHVDPELAFARLPQPYRRIVKIFDTDIINASWDLITQQSARFKAETAAALAATARSHRGNVDSAADPDDYEAAKKRCCKNFDRIAVGVNRTVARIAQHDTLPVLVAALEADSSESSGCTGVTLQLFSTLTHELVAEYTLPTAEHGDPSPPDLAAVGSRTRYQVLGLTPVRVRSVAQDGRSATLMFAVHLAELTTVPASEDQPESTTCAMSIHVFEVAEVDILALSTPGGANESSGSFRLTATGKFEHLAWLEMSPDGQHVALSAVPGSISVFATPDSAKTEESSPDRSSDSPPPIDLSCAPPLMTIKCGMPRIGSSSSCRVHFVVKPTLAKTPPSHGPQLPEAYALLVCYGTKVTKYALSASVGGNVVPSATWTHLAAITASAMDATTQYLVIGLADGAVVVWDSVEDCHHVYLSSSMATVSEVSTSSTSECEDPRIDAVAMYRNEFVIALSSSTQQVRFFDIRKRVAPLLQRIVTVPEPLPTSQHGEGVKLESLVDTVHVLDVPIAAIGYSSGTHMLYDLRAATAIGCIRSRSQANRSAQPSVLASQHGVAAAQSSLLDFYDWYQLLLACFPPFEHALMQREMAQDPVNAKRLLLDSFAGPTIASLAPEPLAAESIDKLLCRTARVPIGTVASRLPGQMMASTSASVLPNQHQPSKNSLGLTESDSCASVGSQSRASASNPDEAPALPSLPEVLLQPTTRSIRERFGEYCRDLEVNVTKDKEVRMHRRRRELIKALTAGAW